MLNFLRLLKFDSLLYITNRIIARTPSHSIRLWFYKHCLKFSIDSGSYVFMDAWFDTPGNFFMGKNSVINQKCRLDNRGGINIGNNVSISSETCILTADHDLNSDTFSGRHRPVVIEDYVFIGTRATILPGVTLGLGSAVAAGAVVTNDVAPNVIVAGIPARPIGLRESEMKYNARYMRLFF